MRFPDDLIYFFGVILILSFVYGVKLFRERQQRRKEARRNQSRFCRSMLETAQKHLPFTGEYRKDRWEWDGCIKARKDLVSMRVDVAYLPGHIPARFEEFLSCVYDKSMIEHEEAHLPYSPLWKAFYSLQDSVIQSGLCAPDND